VVSHLILNQTSFRFEEAISAFDATKKGKSEDGKELIKAIISGPGVSVEEGA
jgi:D-xylulose reductase